MDVGTVACKAGYAGEDTPKAVFPTCFGVLNYSEEEETKIKSGGGDVNMTDEGGDDGTDEGGDERQKRRTTGPYRKGGREFHVNDMGFRRDHMEVKSPFDSTGLVEDWDAVEAIWDHAFSKRLVIQSNEHPVLMAEPTHNTKEAREKMVELMFEKHGPPALFLAKTAVLASFACGRPTSLVVDVGGSSTVVTAVHDGYALQGSITRSPIGGEALTDILLKNLAAKGVDVRPRFAFSRKLKPDGDFDVKHLDPPHTSASYALFKRREIAADLKESVCRLSETTYSKSDNQNIPAVSYELPDGNTIDVGVERFIIPELMFQPHLLSELSVPESERPDWSSPDGTPARGLPSLIREVRPRAATRTKQNACRHRMYPA